MRRALTWRSGRRVAELEASGATYGAGLRPVLSLPGAVADGSPALVVHMQRLELELASDRAASVRVVEQLLASPAAAPVLLVLDYQDCRACAWGVLLCPRRGVVVAHPLSCYRAGAEAVHFQSEVTRFYVEYLTAVPGLLCGVVAYEVPWGLKGAFGLVREWLPFHVRFFSCLFCSSCSDIISTRLCRRAPG